MKLDAIVTKVFRKTDSKMILSLPHSRKVRGYVIKRMPLGAYVTAMKRLQDFPREALQALFPGMDAGGILAQLKTIDTAMLTDLAMRAFTALPEQAAVLVSVLTEIPEDKLLGDPAIGLDGLMEITNAWLEENNIENFFTAARASLAKIKTQAANGSYKG